MGVETRLDRWGYEVKTSSDSCVAAINAYYREVLHYGRNRSVILEGPKYDPNCVLGNILAAGFLSFHHPSRATAFVDAASSHLEHASPHEKAVYQVFVYSISKERDDELLVELYSKLLQDFPRDLASLKMAQVVCFYMARPDLSLKLVEQVLPLNDNEDYIHGMLAFPLLELGRMEDAMKAGRRGYDINSDDPWSQHALCHVYQHQCRFSEAVAFMKECSETWNSLGSFMYTHNWWHVALCYLEGGGSMEEVRYIYDEHILRELERSDSTQAEVYLNALGLLLRVFLRGEFGVFEDRLRKLAKCVTDKGLWFLEWHFDILILWALSYGGEVNAGEELLHGLKSRFLIMTKKKQQLMKPAIKLAEAVFEYGKGDSDRALKLLGHEFCASDYKIIGASDEQLDVFTELHIILLLKGGEAHSAIRAIEEQLKKREAAPFLWSLLERGHAILGSDEEEAASYGKKARELAEKNFNSTVM